MDNENNKQTNNYQSFVYGVIGMLAGGLAGAITMLLFAPQSGKQTRTQIEEIGIQVRDHTTKNIRKTVEQMRSKSNQISKDVQAKVGELKQLGQEKIVAQLDRMSAALDTGKRAVETS
jgi:gas vesicle protein